MSFWNQLTGVLKANRFNNPNRAPTTLIIGSGVSLYPGGCSPFSEIIEDVIGRPLPKSRTTQDFVSAMEEFSNAMSNMSQEGAYEFLRCHLFPSDIGQAYHDIATLAKHGYIHLIITTNLDCCIEAALAREMRAETYQVFEIGPVYAAAFQDNLAKDRLSLLEHVRINVSNPDPPVKVLKLHGSFNTRNMAWDEYATTLIARAILDGKLLDRVLHGPVVVVGHSLADRSIKEILTRAAELHPLKGPLKQRPIFICDRENPLETDAVLYRLLAAGRSKPSSDHWLFGATEGDATHFFHTLCERLITKHVAAAPQRFDVRPDANFVTEKARQLHPRGIHSVWAHFSDVPYLIEGKDHLFAWQNQTIPFAFEYPNKQSLEGLQSSSQIPHFLSLTQVQVIRHENQQYDPKRFRTLSDDEKSFLFSKYNDQLTEEHVKYLRPEGQEWNESRVRFTDWKKEQRNDQPVYMFQSERVPYLWFRATNVMFARHFVEVLLAGSDTGADQTKRKDAKRIFNAISSSALRKNARIIDWFFSFDDCWLAGAVGTSTLLVDDNWCALLAKRGDDLAHHEGFYQASGSGTLDFDADRQGQDRIDVFRSAFRELWFESGILLRRNRLHCLGWGIDATHGHPNFLFLGRPTTALAATKLELLFRTESFETDRFALIDIRDASHIQEFLSHTAMSSNNVSLLVLAHLRAKAANGDLDQFWQ